MSARRPPSAPPEIPGFEYQSLLGSGGFADVFLYDQRMPRRRVAIKVLLKESLTQGAQESFEAEANLMAQLSTHPSIVTIYQAGVADDGRPYLAMEYCPKPNLGARYRKERISVAEALRIGVQVAGAVETSHRAGILHRDIKPANILVTEYNRPALTDFGISVALVGDPERESVGMSIPWSPPEVFESSPSSGVAADVYSLGATVYTLLAGRSPFEVPGGSNTGLDLITRIQSSPLARIGRADVPDSLEDVLATAMAKRPDARYASALELGRALQKIQLELSLSVTPTDVLDESLPAESVEEEDEGNTRVRGIVTIDPTGPAPTGPARSDSSTGARPAQPRWGESLRPDPVHDTVASTIARPGSPARPPAGSAPSRPATPSAPSPSPAGAAPGRAPFAAPSGAAPAGMPVPAADRADAFGIEQTIHRPPQAPTDDEDTNRKRSRLPIIVGASLVAAAVLVTGIVFAVNAGTGSPSAVETDPGVAPIDVLPAQSVKPPTDLKGTVTAEGVVFTWTNPDPQSGDRYQWGVVTQGAETTLQPAAQPTATVPLPAAGGRVCIEVAIVHTDGRGSEPVTGCAP
ncbi:protein kinase [Cnuibacter physcomitrellae]|uniref:serine/threonine-protein kinase n=1 Tax=Cnuibacter physcomitrellae TaxID=1619308 RepID=UPI002175E950|nr:serine/threonine protein kinase [Cnuibacter physcomitrellae]MCS5498142.1 protein kinase [Cnuibacter physcomitrellae]